MIGHDFADGLNTVALMLTHGNDRRRALGMLLLDAVTPVAGAALTLLFTVPDRGLLIYLGVFAGFAGLVTALVPLVGPFDAAVARRRRHIALRAGTTGRAFALEVSDVSRRIEELAAMGRRTIPVQDRSWVTSSV